MTAKQQIQIAQTILAVIDKDLINSSTGNLDFNDPAKDLQAVMDVEVILKGAGLEVPPNVDKVIAIVKSTIDLWS